MRYNGPMTYETPRRGVKRFDAELKDIAVRIFQESCSKQLAAKACGITVQTLNAHMRTDTDFRDRMTGARLDYAQVLQAEAFRRAVDGVTQTKPGPGGIMYDVTTYSDTLLLHLLKKLHPEVHADKIVVEKTVKHEGLSVEQLSPEQRTKLQAILKESKTSE